MGIKENNPLAGKGSERSVDRHFMPPMDWREVKDLYDYCNRGVGSEHVVHLKTLIKVYKNNWHVIIGFRSIGQHARCAICAKLSKTRRDDPDPQKRKQADEDRGVHEPLGAFQGVPKFTIISYCL